MTVVYSGRVFSVDIDQVRLPNGRDLDVTTVRHPPSVVLLPIADDGRIVLIRQFRYSVGRELWELPAGSVNPGESPEEAADRECEEEIRLVPSRVEWLCSLYPTPGYCDELLVYFKVTGLHPPAAGSLRRADEDEDIHPQAFSLTEAKAMALRGDIVDLKTAYGLTLI
jgi:ADP-ribose pyrophosphatase